MNKSNIVAGSDKQAEKAKRQRKKFAQSSNSNITTGYCGNCKTNYKGNYTTHVCQTQE